MVTARAEPLEGRRLFAAGDALAFGAGAPSATLADADGTAVTFALAGPGIGTLARGDDGRLRVSLGGTSAASSLTVTTDAGGDGRAALGDVDVSGALRALTAKTADLYGDLTATDALRTVILNSTAGDGGTIAAPSLGSLGTAGDLRADVRVPGRVNAIAVGGSAADLVVRTSRLDRFDVRGDLTGAKVLLFPDAGHRGPAGLGRLAVRGAMRGSLVYAMADVGSVSTGAMFDSAVAAGVRFEELSSSPAGGTGTGAGEFVPSLPAERSGLKEFDFTGTYSVGAVTVSGAAGRDAGGFAFANARVAAHRVGNVRLAGVNNENGGRLFGVAGYYVSRVQRRFGGPAGDTVKPQASGRGVLSVHQIYEPLTYNPATGTYTGVSSAGFVGNAEWNGTTGTYVPPVTVVPLQGAGRVVGSVANHPAATTIRLAAVDGAYEAVDAGGNVVARHPTATALAVALVGAPGASIKIVNLGAITSSYSGTTPRPASLTFLSTSVGPEMTIVLDAPDTVFRPAAGADVSLPSADGAKAALEALGVAAQVYDAPLLKLRDGDAPLLVGRRFDVERGAREITVMPDLLLHVDGETGTTADVAAAMLGPAALAGPGPTSVRVRYGSTGPTISGLPDGGTAVLYLPWKTALSATGATLEFPPPQKLHERVVALGVPATYHDV